MKIRSLTLAAIVAAGLIGSHAVATDFAEARTIHAGTANGGVWKTTDGGQNRDTTGPTVYVGSANGGVWK